MSSLKSFHISFPTTIERQTLTSLLGTNLGRVLMTSPGWEDVGAWKEALSSPALAQKQNEEQMQTELSAPQLCCAMRQSPAAMAKPHLSREEEEKGEGIVCNSPEALVSGTHDSGPTTGTGTIFHYGTGLSQGCHLGLGRCFL